MTDLARITKPQEEFRQQLIRSRNKEIEELIPDDLDPKTVVRWSNSVGALLIVNDAERTAYLLAAGRLLHLARTNKAVLEEAGAESLKDFESIIDPTGKHRSSIWAASSAYQVYPGLTPARAAEVGSTNLAIATRLAKSLGVSDDRQKEKILDQAAAMSTKEFQARAAEMLGEPNSATSAIFELFGSKAEIDKFKEALADSRFMRYLQEQYGITDPRPIDAILALMEESRSEWPSEENEPVQSGQTSEVVAPAAGMDREGVW